MSRTSDISSKYKDLISKSHLIRPGPCAVYLLKPSTEKVGTVTKHTIGEHNVEKPNKTLLLVGETGTGKSTLVNVLFNHMIGVQFHDKIWFQFFKEKEGEDQTESQTSDVIVYEILDFENQTCPYTLTVIDTPGYGDTRGIEKDLNVRERLFELFRSEDSVRELHAVGLVMKSSINRVTDRLMYILNSMISSFGKGIEKNIIAFLTYSDGIQPRNALEALKAANIKLAKNEKKQPVCFLFNNRQTTERTDEEEPAFETFWKVSERGLFEFQKFMEKITPQKLDQTVEVIKSRIRLEACIKNLQERIMLIKQKQTEIAQIQKYMEENEEEIKKNKNFTIEIDEVYMDKEQISGGMWGVFNTFHKGAVTCSICKENCHYPGCTVAWEAKNCEVMKGGRCTICTKRCPASDHVKETWIYVSKTKTVQKTKTELEEKYMATMKKGEENQSLLEELEKKTDTLKAEKNQWLDMSYQYVVRLDQIAVIFHSLSSFVQLDFLIEEMKKKGDVEKILKLEEMKEQHNSRFMAIGLSYKTEKITKLFKK